MREDIEAFRLEREIPYLLHFTKSENLPSILANGLASRAEIDAGNIAGFTNDNMRLDGRRSFNCLSISFPNAPMFYRFKADNPGSEWPILVVHPRIMAINRTLFCWKNAASTEIAQASDDELSSIHSFKGMFSERAECDSRDDQALKKCDPTHVQAEVLIEGLIPPKAIYCIIFPSVPCMQKYKNIAGERQLLVSDRRGYYGTREYFRKWGVGKNG